jgi:Predicted integral membrane protein (DUF2189)
MTTEPAELPFIAECNDLRWNSAFTWLRLGWKDLKDSKCVALGYGIIIFVVSWAVSAFAWWLGKFALLATLLSGFIFIAPMLAVGLHSVSKDLQAGNVISFRRSIQQMMCTFGHGAVYALILLAVLFIWSRSGMMLYAFFPVEEGSREVLLEFLAVGSLIGSVFAALITKQTSHVGLGAVHHRTNGCGFCNCVLWIYPYYAVAGIFSMACVQSHDK